MAGGIMNTPLAKYAKRFAGYTLPAGGNGELSTPDMQEGAEGE